MNRTTTRTTTERLLTSIGVATVVSLGFLLIWTGLIWVGPADGRAPHLAQASNAVPQSSIASRDQARSVKPSAARFPKNVEEFDRMFEDIKD